MTTDTEKLIVIAKMAEKAQRSAARASTTTWLCMVCCICCLVATIRSCDSQQQTRDGLVTVAQLLQRLTEVVVQQRPTSSPDKPEPIDLPTAFAGGA